MPWSVSLKKLQRLDRCRDSLAVFGLPSEVARLQTQWSVEQIIDFGIDAGDLRDQLAIFLRLLGIRRSASIAARK